MEIRRGREADDVAGRSQARAVTVDGRVFLPDRHGPLDSPSVQGLLAHELVHARAQRAQPGGQRADADHEERQAAALEAAVRSGTEPGPVVVPLARARGEGAPTAGDERGGLQAARGDDPGGPRGAPGDEAAPGAEPSSPPRRATPVPPPGRPGALSSPGRVVGAGPWPATRPETGALPPGDGGADGLDAAGASGLSTPAPARPAPPPPAPFAGLPASGFLPSSDPLTDTAARPPAGPEAPARGRTAAAASEVAGLGPAPTSAAVAVAATPPLPTPLPAPPPAAAHVVARAPEAPGAPGQAGSGEEQLERLYRMLSDRLRQDLLVERERTGGLVDLAWR